MHWNHRQRVLGDGVSGDNAYQWTTRIRDGRDMSAQAASSTGLLLGRLIDITLTYAIVIIVIAGAYPLLNKQLLETINA